MKILILQSAFIGDVTLALPLAEAVKQSSPESEIHFLTLPSYSNFVANHPSVDKVIEDDKKGANRWPLSFIAFCRKLRKEKYDIALIVHRSFRSALICRLSGIDKRIGFDISPGSFLYTEKVKYEQGIHEIERNLKLANVAGFNKWDGAWSVPYDKIFQVSAGHKLIAISPFSNWGTKMWPTEYWIELMNSFDKEFNLAVIGASSDMAVWKEMKNALSREVLDFVGKTDFLQLATLIKNSGILITGDSAPLHFASAFKIPTVCIFGPTIPAFGFGPFGQKSIILQEDLKCRPCNIHGPRKCPLGHHNCMRNLKPEAVFSAVIKLF